MIGKRKIFFKQIVAWCTILTLCLSFIPGYVMAAQESAISLEKAVQTAKTAFNIPKEFSDFTSGYGQYDQHQAWQLRWTSTKEPKGNMYVQVDAQTAEILQMSFWQASKEPATKGNLPVISREEAVEIATELVKSLQPQRMSELKREETGDEIISLTRWSTSTSRIKWTRQVQGVPFPQDGITVNVDNQTGRITGYNFNWTAGDFPDADQAIDLAEVREAWDKAEMLQLQYFYPNTRGTEEPEAERKVMLVYRLVHPSQGILDALTGKPLEFGQGVGIDERASGSLNKMAMDKEEEIVLTPEEIREIEAAGQVVSQKEAETVVERWVTIPEDLTLQSVRLGKDEQRAAEARTWYLGWRNESKEPNDGDVGWVEASVDAINGEVLNFSWGKHEIKEDGQQIKRLNRQEAQEKAEAFLRKIQPELLKQVQLNELQVAEPLRPLVAEQLPLRQYYEYQRIVNGVVFPTNGLSVSVDTTTGEINSYSLRWQQLQFPAPEGILNAAQINKEYLSRQPLILQYMEREGSSQARIIEIPRGNNKEISLVYRPVLVPGQQNEAMCDAKTGTALDRQGKPLAKRPLPYSFTDISGHWAEKEIALLGQAGILGDYGNTFNPERPITVVQFLRALLMLERGVEQVQTLNDQEIIQEATDQGWVKEKLQAGDSINRLLLARWGIRFLDLEQVSKIEGIYTAPYQDFASISVPDHGYVALTWGLGILKGEQGSFRPEQTVTRAQAAVTLVRLLKTQL